MKGNKQFTKVLSILLVVAMVFAVVKNCIPTKITEDAQSLEVIQYGAPKVLGTIGDNDKGTWRQRVNSYASRIGRYVGKEEQKWLFADTEGEYKNLYCVQSGSTHDDVYTIYDLYSLEGDQIMTDYFGNSDNYHHFLWILENMYLTSMDETDPKQDRTYMENQLNAKLGGNAATYYAAMKDELNNLYTRAGKTPTDDKVTFALYEYNYSKGKSELNGENYTIDGRDNFFKAIQNYMLLAYVKQKNGSYGTNPIDAAGNIMLDLRTYSNDGGLVKDYIGNDTNSKKYVHALLKYLKNGYNSSTYDINKYKDFYTGTYGRTQIVKHNAKYDADNNRIGPFYIVNPGGFDVTIGDLKLGNTVINYSIVDADGNAIELDDKNNNNAAFYLKLDAPLDNTSEEKLTFDYDIDFGEVPTAVIFLPKKGTTDASRPQLCINVERRHETKSDSWQTTIDSPNADIALKKYITKINGTAVADRLGTIDLTNLASNNIANHNAVYNMNKTPITVQVGDTITYAIHLFNEGSVDGTAAKITDHLPANMQFIKAYCDGHETLDTTASGSDIIIPNPLGNMDAYETSDTVSSFKAKSQIIYVDCKVTGAVRDKPKYIYTNIAEIKEYQFARNVFDMDSTGNNWSIGTTDRTSDTWSNYSNGHSDYLDNNMHNFGAQDTDDDDFDKVKIAHIDLALTKKINSKLVNGVEVPLTAESRTGTDVQKSYISIEGYNDVINETEDDLTYNMNKTPAVVERGDQIVTTITVYNEGKINGIVKEIADYAPIDLTFDEQATIDLNNNPDLTFYSSTTSNTNVVWIVIKEDPDTYEAEGITLNKITDYTNDCAKYSVKLVFTVSNTASGRLYNSAAITEYGYNGTDGRYVDAFYKGVDKDSWGNGSFLSLKSAHQLYYYSGYDVAEQEFTNYPKNLLQYQDDDDVDAIIVNSYDSKLDLSLRKYVYKVEKDFERSEGVKYATTYNDRVPVINNDSYNTLLNALSSDSFDKSAAYYHDKLKVFVEKGDTVIYRIRVYNEGLDHDYDGQATQITDYLPDGLEFVKIEDDYAEDWSATANADGNVITINYTGDKILPVDSIPTLAEMTTSGDSTGEENYYQEVGIVCKVTADGTDSNYKGKPLTNRAAITERKAYWNGEEVADVKDRDNKDEKTYLDRSTLPNWYNSNLPNEDTPDPFIPGEEDDDDFDTIYVSSYKLSLEKTDGTDILTGAKFKVYRIDAITKQENVDYQMTELTDLEEDLEESGTAEYETNAPSTMVQGHYYIIKEISAPGNFINPFEGRYVRLYIHKDASGSIISESSDNTAPKGFDIYQYEENGDDGDYTNDTPVAYDSLDQNSVYTYGEYDAQIGDFKFIMTNPEMEGQYKLEIGKKSAEDYKYLGDAENDYATSDDDYIAGATFSIEQYLNATSEDASDLIGVSPTATTTADSVDDAATPVLFDDVQEIDITDTEHIDIYKIKETQQPTGYVLNDVELYLKVYKTKNTQINKFVVDKVDVYTVTTNGETRVVHVGTLKNYPDQDTESLTSLWGGTTGNQYFRVDLNKITNTITFVLGNPERDDAGEYSLQLEKRALVKNAQNQLVEGDRKAGVRFSVSGTVDGQPITLEEHIEDSASQVDTRSDRPVRIFTDAQIRTTESDTFTFAETSVDGNTDIYLGTTKNIVVTVTKTVTAGETTDTYSITGATIDMPDLTEDEYTSKTNTKIVLTNGTVIEVSVSNGVVKLLVENPPPEEEGEYSVELEKRGLVKNDQGGFDQGDRLAGVKFTVTGTVDGNAITLEEPVAGTTNQVLTRSDRAVKIFTDQEIRSTDDDTLSFTETDIGDNEDYYLGTDKTIVVTVEKETEETAGLTTYRVKSVKMDVTGLTEEEIQSKTDTKIVLKNGTTIEVTYSNGLVKLLVANPPTDETGNYSVALEKVGLVKENDGTFTEGSRLAGVKFTVSGTVDGTAITPEELVENTTDQVLTRNDRAVRIITAQEIRTENEDTFNFKETDIGEDNQNEYYLGLDKTIVVKVQKTSETVDGLTTYSVTGAKVSVTGLAAADIESQSDTEIKLKNGTVIRVTFANNTVTLLVANPPREEEGTYSLRLEKKGLVKGNDGTFTEGARLGGVKFTVTGTVDSRAITLEEPVEGTTNQVLTRSDREVKIFTDADIRTTNEDTFYFTETDIGSQNTGFFLGTQREITVKVQKTSETTDGLTTYTATGATLSISGIPESEIESQTDTEIKLKNGTIIRVTFANNTATLLVANPPRDETGKYSLKLEKRGLKENADGTFTELGRLGGVTFNVTGTVDGTAITPENPVEGTTNNVETSADDAISIFTDKDIRQTTSDTFSFTETNIGDNTDYYLGTDKAIVVTVTKTSEETEELTTYKATGATVDIQGIAAADVESRSDDNTEIKLKNGTVVRVTFADDTVTLLVANPPKTPEGDYNIFLTKTGTNGKKIGGIQFESKGYFSEQTKRIPASGRNVISSAQGKVELIPDDWKEEPGKIIIEPESVEVADYVELTEVGFEEDAADEDGLEAEGNYFLGFFEKKIKVVINKNVRHETATDVYYVESIGLEIGEGDDKIVAENTSDTEVSYEDPDTGAKVIVSYDATERNVNIIISNPSITREGTYNLNLLKLKKGSEAPVGGVTFTGTGHVQSQDIELNNGNDIVTSADGPVEVYSEVPMDEDTIEDPDVYTFTEVSVGDENDDIYVGIPGDIELTVEKEMTNENPLVYLFSVKKISLKVNGEAVTPESDTKSTFTTTDELGNEMKVTVEYNEDTKTITVTAVDPTKKGKFDLGLIKTVKGTNPVQYLAGAKFKIEIKDGNETIYSNDNLVTRNNGHIDEIQDLEILSSGRTYTITVEELSAPTGYIGLGAGNVRTFTATSVAKEKEYALETATKAIVENDKYINRTIDENYILIEVENRIEPVIHKGVRTVENQDAGYDGDEIQTWVINTSVPVGIEDYTEYNVTDEIDFEKEVGEKRIEFLGKDSIVVKVKGTDTVLTEGTDYNVTVDSTNTNITIDFIVNDGHVSDAVTACSQSGNGIIEITYNTKFVLDEDGLIVGLNQEIPNKATLNFNGNGKEHKDKESEIPEVHTGAVGVKKYEDVNNNGEFDDEDLVLEGAHFKIARTKEEADKAVKAALEGDEETLATINFVKVRDEEGNETDVDVELITDDHGEAIYQGLEFGENASDDAENNATHNGKGGSLVYEYEFDDAKTTYYLVETEAPYNYYLLNQADPFEVSKNSFVMKDYTKYLKEVNKPKIYDLSLRKFITYVEGEDTNGNSVDRAITDRIPQVTLTDEFKNGDVTTAKYEHTKEPVIVQQGNTVTYTIRIYNEGPEDAFAAVVKDDIPDGVKFIEYTEGDGSVNDTYRWKLVDENDEEVDDVSKAKYIVTDYLSMEQGEVKDGVNENLIKAYDSKTMDELDYRDVKVQFYVTEPNTSERIITNYAQIAYMTNKDGKGTKDNVKVIDRDSTPNEWIDGEDDQDVEHIRLLYFDLALRKWVTKAIVIQDGQETVYETGHKAEDDPEDVVKVDLKKSKLDKVIVKFEYQIRITNEGKLGGWCDEITDHIPDGLTFDQADNPIWAVVDNKTVTTDALKDTYLEPGESAEVTIVLRWENSGDNLGIKVNIAEISKDRNEYGAHDIDSTPGNYKWGEDDIDDAPVMLAVTTGNMVIGYAILGLVVVSIIAVGAKAVKKVRKE